MLFRLASAFSAALLVCTACASSDGESKTAEVNADKATATTDAATTTVDRSAVLTIDELAPEELAFIAGEFEGRPLRPTTTTTTRAATTATAPATSGAAATTSTATTGAAAVSTGGGGSPVTTTPGGGGGVDPAIYVGVLGRLGRDELYYDPGRALPTHPAVPGVLPLTGVPGEVPNRPAAVVKIDNGSRARPHSGLNAADIVVEEEVEGGITRFAAVFHSTSSVVGPIRSARTTDIGIINGFGSPLLLYSGANELTDSLIRAQPTVQNRNAGTSSGFWRSSSRRAPSNLYSDTAPHWASATGGPPPPQFSFRPAGAPAAGSEVGSFSVVYRASTAGWTWDGSAWLRSQGGRAHMTDGHQVSAANVVVAEVEVVDTGMVDSSGSTVPEFVFVGTGRVTVYSGGRKIGGTWIRPTLASVVTLMTDEGATIELGQGRTWIELVRPGHSPG